MRALRHRKRLAVHDGRIVKGLHIILHIMLSDASVPDHSLRSIARLYNYIPSPF